MIAVKDGAVSGERGLEEKVGVKEELELHTKRMHYGRQNRNYRHPRSSEEEPGGQLLFFSFLFFFF